MSNIDKRRQRHSDEDAVFNKMLLCLVCVIIAEAVVLLVKRFYIEATASDFGIALFKILDVSFAVFVILGFVLTVLGIVWCLLAQKKEKSLKLPGILTAVVAFLWVLSVFARLLSTVGIRIMVVLPIVAAVLILIYFLYQRAFFVNTILTGCGMAGLWCFRQFYDSHPVFMIAAFVVGWLVLIAVAVFAYSLKKNGGKLGKNQIVNDQKSYNACWLTCAVVMVSTVLALVLGLSLAFYLIYALIGWLFCLAVYYTVKLI